MITSENADTGQYVRRRTRRCTGWRGPADIDVNLDAAAADLGKNVDRPARRRDLPRAPRLSFAARVREVAALPPIPQSPHHRVKLTLAGRDRAQTAYVSGMTGDAVAVARCRRRCPPGLTAPPAPAPATAPMFKIPATAIFFTKAVHRRCG